MTKPYEDRLGDKRSSQALMATSLGEESFIHPPSPIGPKNHMKGRFNSGSKAGLHVAGREPGSEQLSISEQAYVKARGNENSI